MESQPRVTHLLKVPFRSCLDHTSLPLITYRIAGKTLTRSTRRDLAHRDNCFCVFLGDSAALLTNSYAPKDLVTGKSTKAPEGATAGGGSGVLIGSALGWLVGIGALALPGLGPFIAAGPLMASLAGLGVGGVVGGITGALIGAGLPESEAKRYEGRLTKGSILVSVHCDKPEENCPCKGSNGTHRRR